MHALCGQWASLSSSKAFSAPQKKALWPLGKSVGSTCSPWQCSSPLFSPTALPALDKKRNEITRNLQCLAFSFYHHISRSSHTSACSRIPLLLCLNNIPPGFLLTTCMFHPYSLSLPSLNGASTNGYTRMFEFRVSIILEWNSTFPETVK